MHVSNDLHAAIVILLYYMQINIYLFSCGLCPVIGQWFDKAPPSLFPLSPGDP